ncbi:MAG: hypothetical protein J6T56_06165 [Bacteroidales bacterium]|nr:hypothetical protein [Bacteroidales bacterium]
MIKRTLILSALVCAMAGEMYASNTETQVVNPQPESVRILQEQLLSQTSLLTLEQRWEWSGSATVTVNNKTYSVSAHLQISHGHFSFNLTITTPSSKTINVTGSAPYSNTLTGSDITASIEGEYDEDEFDMDILAEILNAIMPEDE